MDIDQKLSQDVIKKIIEKTDNYSLRWIKTKSYQSMYYVTDTKLSDKYLIDIRLYFDPYGKDQLRLLIYDKSKEERTIVFDADGYIQDHPILWKLLNSLQVSVRSGDIDEVYKFINQI